MDSVIKHYLVILLFALLAPACGVFSQPELGEMTLKRYSGTLKVVRADDVISVEKELGLEEGDVIQSGSREMSAKLRLTGSRVIFLRGLGELRVVDGRTAASQGMDVLGRTRGDPMSVRAGETTASTDKGRFRIDQGIGALRFAAYEEGITLRAPSETPLRLQPFFESSFTAATFSQPRPYRLRYGDAWDMYFLDWVIELDRELTRLGGALADQTGGTRPQVEYFSTLAGGKDVSFVDGYLGRPVDDLLIAFTIAGPADGPFQAAFEEAFELRREGARWGIAGAILGLRPDSAATAVADLRRTILRTGVASGEEPSFTVAAAEPSAGIAPEADGPVLGSDSTGNDTGSQASSPTGSGRDQPGDGGSPGPSPSPGGCANVAECTLNDVIPNASPTTGIGR